MAISIWMVDGLPLFSYGRNVYKQLVSKLSRLNQAQINILFYQVHGLNQRSDKCLSSMEAFFYEPESNALWEETGGLTPCDDKVTGFEGVSKLGMNRIQSTWTSWHKMESKRRGNDYLWSLAKLIFAPHAPKAYEKMNRQDKEKSRDLSSQRQAVQDKAYYKYKGILDSEGRLVGSKAKEIMANSQGVQMARSTEELSEEMKRWVSGDEDHHDKVIKQFKQRMREGYEKKKHGQKIAVEEFRSEIEKRELQFGEKAPPLVGYTLDQLSKSFGDKILNTSVRRETTTHKFEHIYSHFLAREPVSGNLSLNNSGDIEVEEGSSEDINDRIARRQFTL